MAIVYKAYDTRLERDVAIKMIRRGAFPADHLERMLKRFEREAKALARLSHPNIIKILDYGEYEGSPYLVMEYFPGGTLKEKLGKPLPWQEAIQLLLPITEALDYAHDQNMVHRDVKPANILLTQRGQPMLTDFGIAKLLESEETQELTGTSVAVGTPEYMAPEQANAKTVDHRADIYSLGIVLYEMVTGRKPFVADTPMAVLIMHARDPLPKPRKYVPNLPPRLEQLLIKTLAKNPSDRYQSMGELAMALKNITVGPQSAPFRGRTQDARLTTTQRENVLFTERLAPVVQSNYSRLHFSRPSELALAFFALVTAMTVASNFFSNIVPIALLLEAFIYLTVVINTIRHRRGQEFEALFLGVFALVALALQVLEALWRGNFIAFVDVRGFLGIEAFASFFLAFLLVVIVRTFVHQEGWLWLLLGILWTMGLVALNANLFLFPHVIWTNGVIIFYSEGLPFLGAILGSVLFMFGALGSVLQALNRQREPTLRNRIWYLLAIILLLIVNDCVVLSVLLITGSPFLLVATMLMDYVILARSSTAN